MAPMAATVATRFFLRAVSRAAAGVRAPGACPALHGARRALATSVTGDDFFVRTREIATLRNIFDHEPQLTVVLGGPSTGKSRLLAHMLCDPAGPYAAVHIDLRSIALQDHQHLGRTLVSRIPAWATPGTPLHTLLRDMAKDDDAGTVHRLPNWNRSPERTLKDFTNTLSLLAEALPKRRRPTGTERAPVLFIDEAHLLSEISRAPNDAGAVALRAFLEWCVLNTKQEGRFHVVFASTDCFFVNWLVARGIGPHVFPQFVGDLDREQARAYYQQRLDWAKVPSRTAVPSFDEVYRVCGGHMLSIREYLRDALSPATVSGKEQFVFGRLQAACSKLVRLVPVSSAMGVPCTRAQLLSVFAAIHRDGWLDDYVTRMTLGDEAVKALIDRDVVHFRPISPIVEDLPGQPAEAVLTAFMPVERAAMGIVASRRGPRTPDGASSRA
jgi:hypothetical protein